MTPPVRLLLIGCGRVCRRYHLPALRHLGKAEIRGIAEPDPRAAMAARPAAEVPVFADAARLLAEVEADAALILTPPESHAALVAGALARELHVFVEKPLADRSGEAIRLASLAVARGRILQVGFNRRLRPAYRALRRALRKAGPGPHRFDLRLRTPGGRWGRGGRDEETLRDELLFDLGSHLVDLAAWLAGTPIAELRAKPLQLHPRGPELDAELVLRGGSRAYCRIGYGRRQEERVIVRQAQGLLVATPWTCHRGTWTALTGLGDRLRRLADLGGARLGLGRNLTQRTFDTQLDLFLEGVRRGRADPAVADAEAGVAATRAVDAWRRSLAAHGSWMRIEPSTEGTSRS